MARHGSWCLHGASRITEDLRGAMPEEPGAKEHREGQVALLRDELLLLRRPPRQSVPAARRKCRYGVPVATNRPFAGSFRRTPTAPNVAS